MIGNINRYLKTIAVAALLVLASGACQPKARTVKVIADWSAPPLRNVSAREFGPERVKISLAGQSGRPLKLRELVIGRFTATDAAKQKLWWCMQALPDSEYGPMAIICVQTHSAEGAVELTGIVSYHRIDYHIRATFVATGEDTKTRRLENMDVGVLSTPMGPMGRRQPADPE